MKDFKQFYLDLENRLPESTEYDRKNWANFIINNNIDIKELSNLLYCKKPIALRFSWLISDIGLESPETLFQELVFLFNLIDNIKSFNFTHSFATYWKISGIPNELESEALNLLFNWINDSKINATTKFRAMHCLKKLMLKYPEIKGEFKLCLENQLGKNTNNFNKQIEKVLAEIEN